MDANMQLTINSFRQLFPDKIFFHDISLIFSKIPDISLTAVKFPDISRFSRQVVTLRIKHVRLYSYLLTLHYNKKIIRRKKFSTDKYTVST